MDKKNPEISIFTFKIFFFATGFFVFGLRGRFCWINNNLVDVCVEIMPILLHSHFHQAGTWRENSAKCMGESPKAPVTTTRYQRGIAELHFAFHE